MQNAKFKMQTVRVRARSANYCWAPLRGSAFAAGTGMFEHPQPPDTTPRREGVPDVIDAPPPDIPVVPPPDIPPADLPDVHTPQRDVPGPR